jgi:hypothetical protein
MQLVGCLQCLKGILMRGRAPEDMSEQEYNDLKYDNQTTNPHRRCVCANQNNDDGSCSHCEWEEEHNNEIMINKYNEISRLVRAGWGDNAVEYLVGTLSSLCSEDQLDILIAKLKKESL